MKKVIVALTAVAMVGGAYADIYANLSAGFGISGAGSAGGLVDAVDGTELVLQIISGGGDGLDGGAVYDIGLGEFVMTGNDVLLATLTAVVTAGGADYSDYAATLGGDVTVIPWVGDTYLRASGIGNGDLVYEQAQPFADLNSADPLQLPEKIFWDANGAGGVAGPGTVTVIPEPATIGLMGIAGLGMFLARRKARR